VAGNAGPGTTQNVGLEGHSPGVLPSSSKSNLGKHWPVVVLAWLALLALLAVLGYKTARTWLPALIRRSSDG
jgi:O-antigen ligase